MKISEFHRFKLTLLATFLLGLLGGALLTHMWDSNSLDEKTAQGGLDQKDGMSVNDLLFDPKLFSALLTTLQDHYLYQDRLSEEELFYGMMDGLVQAVDDPYTEFFDPEETDQFRSSISGEFAGIGGELYIDENGNAFVLSVIPGSPAEQAGLQANDQIVSVNGVLLQGMSYGEIQELAKGKVGEIVVIDVSRDDMNEPIELTLTRELIQAPSVHFSLEEFEGHSIAIIQIYSFKENTSEEFQEAIQTYFQSGAEGIILDLRYNGGGLIQESVEILGEFFDEEKKALIVQRYDSEEEDNVYLSGEGRLSELPVVILVNSGTASSSEIMAGAFQDYERAIIIGTQTFGKGVMQDLYDLPSGTMLKVTTAEWFTPDGRNIQDVGITPDLIVEMDSSFFNTDEDLQIQEGIQTLLTLISTP